MINVEIKFRCNVVKYDPGENFKMNVVFIMDFEVETWVLREIMNKLLKSPLLLPMKSIDFINETIGNFSEFYYSELRSRANIEFLDQNCVMLHFENGSIPGMIEKEALDKWEVRSVSELCEGDNHKNVILTNHLYGKEHDEITETYYIPIRPNFEGSEKFC